MKSVVAGLAWAGCLLPISAPAALVETAQGAPPTGCGIVAGGDGGIEAIDGKELSIPALHPVAIAIVEPLSSKTALQGACFRIKLVEPIVIEGVELVPAGSDGMGQVVHAAKARAGGKGGELILAARYIRHGAIVVPLRSLQFSKAGKDQLDVALAASSALPMAGYLFTGSNVWVEAGTIGTAKVRHPVRTGRSVPMQQDDILDQRGRTGE